MPAFINSEQVACSLSRCGRQTKAPTNDCTFPSIPSSVSVMPRFMLDTNVFNHVLEGKIDFKVLNGRDLIATHVQHDEITQTKDEGRRTALLAVFRHTPAEQVATESAVFGVSRWGQAKWGSDDGLFGKMRADLDVLNKRKGNNPQDILIAETALRNGWVLVTSDADLFAVVTKHGGACMNAYAMSAA